MLVVSRDLRSKPWALNCACVFFGGHTIGIGIFGLR